jgi:hypothetical protein
VWEERREVEDIDGFVEVEEVPVDALEDPLEFVGGPLELLVLRCVGRVE